MNRPQPIINLCFDGENEAADIFYTGIFSDSGIGRVTRYPEAGKEILKKTPGSGMTVEFHLGDQRSVALNGELGFRFNDVISIEISCGSQEEIDYYRERSGTRRRSCGAAIWLDQGSLRTQLAGDAEDPCRGDCIAGA